MKIITIYLTLSFFLLSCGKKGSLELPQNEPQTNISYQTTHKSV